MNKPLIKGTPLYKAATKPIVQQVPAGSDAGLINAAKELGLSYVPRGIDFTIDHAKTDFGQEKKKEEPQDSQVKGCTDSKATNFNASATIDDGSCEFPEENDTDQSENNEVDNDTDSDENVFNSVEFKGNPGDPYTYRTASGGGYEYTLDGQNWSKATHSKAIDAISNLPNAPKNSPVNKNHAKHVTNDTSPINKLNNKIFNSAVPNGVVQNNMIKNGYKQ